jgi:hypothetical protein
MSKKEGRIVREERIEVGADQAEHNKLMYYIAVFMVLFKRRHI